MTVGRTGGEAPVSGVWRPSDDGTSLFLSKGDNFPPGPKSRDAVEWLLWYDGPALNALTVSLAEARWLLRDWLNRKPGTADRTRAYLAEQS